MIIRIVLSIFLFGSTLSITPAQSPVYEVSYLADHEMYGARKLNGENKLKFSVDKSIYTHQNYPYKSGHKVDGFTVDITAGDPEKFPVYISVSDSLIIGKVKGLVGGGKTISILEEPLREINWEITEEQKTIGNFSCIKAFGDQEGRTYEAWFTLEIPVPFGPYRLYGLPGLILEAHSTDGKVNWTFTGYRKLDSEPEAEITEPTFGNRYTWEELVEARIKHKRRMESRNDMDTTVGIRDPYEGFYIELGKWNIFEKYLSKK